MNTKKITFFLATIASLSLNLPKKTLFNEKRLNKVNGQDELSITPLPHKKFCLLLGSIRSGTTLLSQCLSLHSQLYSPEELHIAYVETARKIYEDYPKTNIGATFLLGFLHAVEELLDDDRKKALTIWYQMIKQNMPIESLYSYLHNQSGNKIVIDKTPGLPMMYQSKSTIIKKLLKYKPNFIYLHRHPLSMIHSSMNLHQGIAQKKMMEFYTNNDNSSSLLYPDHHQYFREAANESPSRFWEAYWLHHNQSILDLIKEIDQKTVCQTSYENLLRAPEKELQRICQLLEVDYQENMLDISQIRPKSYSHWNIIKSAFQLKMPLADPNLIYSPKKLRSINPDKAEDYKKLEHQWKNLMPETRALANQLGYETPAS